jgi:hypothetical protein
MKRTKNILLLLLLIFGDLVFSQSNYNSKLRISFDFELISKIQDSCFLLIFQGDEIKEKIDLLELKSKRNNDDIVLFEKIIPPGDYIVIIENLISKLIIINNLDVKPKLITFLPLNYSDLITGESPSNAIIVKDAKKIFAMDWMRFENR